MKRDMRVMIGVDVETDVGSFTPFYTGVREGVPLLLSMFKRLGVRGTFFFTGDAARENVQQARMVAQSPSELGCHSLFHETVGDELFPIPGVRPLLPEEVGNRLRIATEWVEEAGGVRPISFRCPRLWGSTAVVAALESLGYVADASYPMYFYRQQFAPYYPLRTDWTKAGIYGREDTSGVLEIPNFADMTMESRDPGLERDRDQWPIFRTEGADALYRKIAAFREFAEKRELPAVISIYIHPWEFVAMQESYHFGECTVIPDPFIIKNCGEFAVRELERLIMRLLEDGAVFTTCAELADRDNLV